MENIIEKMEVKPRAMCKTSGVNLPVWFHKVPSMSTFPTLNENIKHCDTTVVGGGISGMTTAYLLNKMGKSVVLLEDGEIASGETGRTTAHLANGVDDRYFEIAKSHGKEDAKNVAQSHTAAIDLIESIIKENNIECEFERLDGYLFLAPEHKQDYLEKELFAAREAGLNVEMSEVPFPKLTEKETKGSNHGPAVKFPNQAQFHPTKYMKALSDICAKNGVKIYTNTHVVEFKEIDNDTAVVNTKGGHTVTSNSLVVATNLPANDRVTMYTKVEPYRSYVVVAKVPKGSVKRALYWSTSDPYVYVRVTNGDDNEHDYLIVGGEDHYTGQHHPNIDERYHNLIQWTRERFPMVQGIVNKWSGQVVEPVDDLAFLGRNPGSKSNVYIITGDSGNGLTHGTIGAMIISDSIGNKSNSMTKAWEKTYDPSRLMSNEITEFIKHNIHVQSQYKDWITPGEIKDIEDLKPGCGGIMRKGLSKVALYRDDGGKLHCHSAVCPHLGGIVNWNPSEKSFDCPCHGSRFDPYGMVLNAPAVSDLAEVDVSKL